MYVDNSEITKILPRGRFSIKVKEATDIRKRDDTSKAPKTDVFVRVKLGIAERHPYKATKVKRKQGLNPKFDNEIISFDITDPGQVLTHSLTYSLTHLLTHSLTHLLTHSLTYSLTHSLTYLLTH